MSEKITLNKQLNSFVTRTINSGVKPLELIFEPVYDCTYGEVEGYRAGVYVNSVITGRLTPEDYMRSDADGRLLADLSLRAIKKVCAATSAAENAGITLKCIFIRCATTLLEETDLFGRIKTVLREENRDGDGLYLEFLPEAFELDAETLANAFRDIRAAGLKTAIDGYGGKDFPIEKVISVCPDVAFTAAEVAKYVTDREKYAAVAPLINLVKGLGGKVIAENVSTDEELREFRMRDCFGFTPSESYAGSTGATKMRLTDEELCKEGGGDE